MNLPFALSCAGWRFTLSSGTRPLSANPKITEHISTISVTAPGRANPVEMVLRTSGPTCLQSMLVVLMSKHFAREPVFVTWRKSRGHVPVRLVLSEEDLVGVGAPMHTALRKLADGPQSVITWNALHHMHADDRIALWSAVAAFLREQFADGRTPLRRELAQGLADTVTRVLDDRRYEACGVPQQHAGGAELDSGLRRGRTQAQEFALSMMHQGARLTEIEEWMWGWLGFVVEDVPVSAPADDPVETPGVAAGPAAQ